MSEKQTNNLKLEALQALTNAVDKCQREGFHIICTKLYGTDNLAIVLDERIIFDGKRFILTT